MSQVLRSISSLIGFDDRSDLQGLDVVLPLIVFELDHAIARHDDSHRWFLLNENYVSSSGGNLNFRPVFRLGVDLAFPGGQAEIDIFARPGIAHFRGVLLIVDEYVETNQAAKT